MDAQYILDITAWALGLTPADLRSPCRSRPLAEARFIGLYLAKHLTGASLGALAALLGRHHSTAHHAIGALPDLYETSPDLRARYRRVVRALRAADPDASFGARLNAVQGTLGPACHNAL